MGTDWVNKGAMTATVVVAAVDSLNKGAANYICDGTSDEDEINLAIATGRRVLLLDGTFTIDGQIILADNVTIQGQGKGITIIRQADAADIDMFLVSGIDNFTLRDLTIDGNRANQGDYFAQCLDIVNSDYGLVENVHFMDYGSDAHAWSWAVLHFRTTASAHWKVLSCDFSDCKADGIIANVVGVNDVQIDNCNFDTCGLYADGTCPIRPTEGSYNWQISNINAVSCAYSTIHVYGSVADPCYGINISNCHTQGNTEADAYRFYHSYNCTLNGCTSLNSDRGIVRIEGACYDISVTNCSCKNPGDWGYVVGTRDAENPHDIIIDSCIIEGYQTGLAETAFYLVSLSNGIISNNIIKNYGETGWPQAIQLNACVDCVIEGNIIKDDRGPVVLDKGIHLNNGCLRCVVSNNVLRGFGAYGIQLNDADDCIIADNEISDAVTGIYARDGDDNLFEGNRIQCTEAIDIDHANAVRTVLQGNNWEGSTNNPSYAAATTPRFQNNINIAGGWWGTTTKYVFLEPYGYTTGVTAASGRYHVCALADTVVDGVYLNMRVPEDFVSFVSLQAVWFSSPAAGNMYWGFWVEYNAAGEVRGIHTEGPGYGATATGGVNIFNVQEAANPITFVNLAKGDYVGIYLPRDASNALDTLDGANVNIVGVIFVYIGEDTSTK